MTSQLAIFRVFVFVSPTLNLNKNSRNSTNTSRYILALLNELMTIDTCKMQFITFSQRIK